ncbi:MAG: GGDEF domain-containing protein [Sulfurospirillaceae bacterium]|nr:GGDEF domain-containing protein [Sulfurospirillaceae bacterium]
MLSKHNTELKKLSSIDGLTGIYNRMWLDKMLIKEIHNAERNSRPLSIIMIDIDFFKDVNDKFGHQAGDRFLKKFALLLDDNIRISDILGRYGGEEFLIICRETDLNGAYSLANALRIKIELETFGVDSAKTASFGVAQLRENDTLETFLKRADERLYIAKKEGRNRVVCQSLDLPKKNS